MLAFCKFLAVLLLIEVDRRAEASHFSGIYLTIAEITTIEEVLLADAGGPSPYFWKRNTAFQGSKVLKNGSKIPNF